MVQTRQDQEIALRPPIDKPDMQLLLKPKAVAKIAEHQQFGGVLIQNLQMMTHLNGVPVLHMVSEHPQAAGSRDPLPVQDAFQDGAKGCPHLQGYAGYEEGEHAGDGDGNDGDDEHKESAGANVGPHLQEHAGDGSGEGADDGDGGDEAALVTPQKPTRPQKVWPAGAPPYHVNPDGTKIGHKDDASASNEADAKVSASNDGASSNLAAEAEDIFGIAGVVSLPAARA